MKVTGEKSINCHPATPDLNNSVAATTTTASSIIANTLYVVVRPSVCLSSVTFVHSSQPVEIFGNISTPFGAVAIL